MIEKKIDIPAKMTELAAIGGFSLILIFFSYKIIVIFSEFIFLLVINIAGAVYPNDFIFNIRDNSAEIADNLVFSFNDFDEILMVTAGIFFSLSLLVYLGSKTAIFTKKRIKRVLKSWR